MTPERVRAFLAFLNNSLFLDTVFSSLFGFSSVSLGHESSEPAFFVTPSSLSPGQWVVTGRVEDTRAELVEITG